MLKDFRGKLTVPQFLALELHLFPHRKPETGWPPAEPRTVDCDDMSWPYVRVACDYICHGSTFKEAGRMAGPGWEPRSASRARDMVAKFVRVNAQAFSERHNLRVWL